MLKNNRKLLTEEEFDKVLEVVKESYRLQENNPHLVSALRDRIVEGATIPLRERETTAEVLRNQLWNMYTGGDVSASVTREAYEAIGRSDECDDQWT